MNSPLDASARHKSLHRLILKATDAPLEDIGQICEIMRTVIFHSTLDWQSREQLADAARQAYVLLDANRELYAFRQASALARFQEMRLQAAIN